MLKVEGRGDPIDPHSLKASYNYFFFEASRLLCSLNHEVNKLKSCTFQMLNTLCLGH